MREFRANAKQERGDADGIGVGELGQVAGAHQHFRFRQARARFAIARERIR